VSLLLSFAFSKVEVAARVAETIEKLKLSKSPSQEVIGERMHEPELQDSSDDDGDDEGGGYKTISSITSDARAEGESTTAGPSLYGEDDGPSTPPPGAGTNFFSAVGVAQDDGGSHAVHKIPHTNYGLDSSAAATIGSGPSSVTSETLKSNSSRIYPTDESKTDRLVMKALVLGDSESVFSLCLSSDRYADAILLVARGGEDLLRRTQKAYFERRTIALPYLRLFQSIVTNDLADIVQMRI
jgi:protein transport protein SEC31